MQALADIDAPLVETSVASAGTCDIGATSTRGVLITGTTTVTSFGSRRFRQRFVRFGGALILTHNATSLILPGAANITTAAGDTAVATSDGSGNWTVLNYARASGKALAGPAAADITDSSTSGRTVLTGTAAAGATALGLGTGNSPTFTSLKLTGSATFGGQLGADQTAALAADYFTGGRAGRLLAYSHDSTTANFEVWTAAANTGAARVLLLSAIGDLSVTGSVRPATVTVAQLASLSPTVGDQRYVSNGRKIGEAAGSGTGVPAYYSNGSWRRLSDDTPVVA
ncbi:hypothetical protein [Methylobacterium sp. 17Sr1-1]|uniref:hypothetical protein n=1 Tax=Methylobacterium sp. 17Sr1-1 TaxID=2202826 RepID=UPI000D7010E2|nr:hypothetical protein [Methylobacterium sp. 17Sr1-1]AWN55074.1 hypothetical protein DK412_28495 [Methylobacterium sp. 17Sr1-1]